jgi:hypothetical protein
MIASFTRADAVALGIAASLVPFALAACSSGHASGSGGGGTGASTGTGSQATSSSGSSSSSGAGAATPDAGSCAPACTDGGTCCGAICADTVGDPNNCGACGVVCAAGDTCCRGSCANLANDPKNCGACHVACPAGDLCSATGCSDWATWPMPNPPEAGLPNPASYTVMTGYVQDTVTRLSWQQPIDVPNDLGTSCSGGCTQAQAVAYCSNLTLAGFHDWRAPTRIELASLVDYTSQNPAIAAAFSGTPSSGFWTSSPYLPNAGVGWYVNFADGFTSGVPVSFATGVRCVRGG